MISAELLFYLKSLATTPYPVVDRERGGLSSEGVDYYDKEIRKLLSPFIVKLLSDPDNQQAADLFKDQHISDEGTDSFSLSDQSKQELFDLLKENNVNFSDFHKGLLGPVIV